MLQVLEVVLKEPRKTTEQGKPGFLNLGTIDIWGADHTV